MYAEAGIFLCNHKMIERKNITVLMGGPGSEREVSLRSGNAVAKALEAGGAVVTACEVGSDCCVEIPEGTDFVFNLIHGTFGEDGELQALLDARGVCYTGEGVDGSRVAFDKILSKKKFDEHGIPTVRWEILQRDELPKMPLPMVLKAPLQGSSVGVHIVRDTSEIAAALEDCLCYGDEVLVEEFFEGRELTVGIVGDTAFPIVEIVPREGFYDYEHKYTKGASEYFCPAQIDEVTTKRIQDAALAAHRALGLETYSRVDVMLAPDGTINVLEANTIPGMTETSLLPKAASALGMSFTELCDRIAEISLKRFSKA